MRQAGMERYAGSGAWNYLGEIVTSLQMVEFSSQVALWMVLKSPIQLQAPISDLSAEKMSFLLNLELMAISQDSLKKQASLLRHEEYQTGFQ